MAKSCSPLTYPHGCCLHTLETSQILSSKLHLSFLRLLPSVNPSLGVSSKHFSQMFSCFLTSFSRLFKEMVFSASSDWPIQISDFEFNSPVIHSPANTSNFCPLSLRVPGKKQQWVNLLCNDSCKPNKGQWWPQRLKDKEIEGFKLTSLGREYLSDHH